MRRLLVLLLCAATIWSKPCSYQNPRVEDVIIGVDIGDVSGSRSKRGLGDDHFLPLRIHLHYDETITKLSADKQHYVNGTLLPEAIGFWERVLKVRRAKSPLLLKRKCTESFMLWDSQRRILACAKGCVAQTICGDSVVPPAHLQPCHYCEYIPNKANDRCFMEGKAGSGIPETDFVLYVSSKDTPRCVRNDTLAYAAHCQQEALLDRPIAGHVNLCPSALSTHAHDQEVLISTVKHEILHALGFSAGLFAFFRDDEGRPRTKRNNYGRPMNLNKAKGHYEWDRTTIDTVLRPDWWTAEGQVVHPVQMLVTPRVKREARLHYGCPTLEGAELENQGGEGTALTHWEKRVFENEAMTGTHTQNPVYSRMTFALLEDTGWYRTNYEMAEELHWGRDLGCEFVQKSCGEWISKRRKNNAPLTPFCNLVKHDGRRSLAVTKCNLQRDSIALCNLVPHTLALPKEFRNLDHIDGLTNSEGMKYYGGSVELADFCPYNQEFEWKGEDERRRDSRCEIETNRLENDELMEVYGENSRCFDFGRPWVEKKCGKVRTFHRYMAGCYEHSCIDGTLHIGLFNTSRLYPCRFEGQHVHIRKITESGWLREGTLICPRCGEFCTDCRLDDDVIRDDEAYIGDPPLDEPCTSPSVHSITVILLCVLVHAAFYR